MEKKINGTYKSIWDGGSAIVKTNAIIDVETGLVEAEAADVEGLDLCSLDREEVEIEISGNLLTFTVELNVDNEYAVAEDEFDRFCEKVRKTNIRVVNVVLSENSSHFDIDSVKIELSEDMVNMIAKEVLQSNAEYFSLPVSPEWMYQGNISLERIETEELRVYVYKHTGNCSLMISGTGKHCGSEVQSELFSIEKITNAIENIKRESLNVTGWKKPEYLVFYSFESGEHHNFIAYSFKQVMDSLKQECNNIAGQDDSYDEAEMQKEISISESDFQKAGDDAWHEFPNSTWVTVTRVKECTQYKKCGICGCEELGEVDLHDNTAYCTSCKQVEPYELKDKTPTVFTLVDEETDESLQVSVSKSTYGLYIGVEGYSDASSEDGEIVMIDCFDGKLSVKVWSDIEQENFTHCIDLSGAKKKEEGK